MAGRAWREAATLIIVGRGATRSITKVKGLDETDYNLLFLKRSKKSSFMPNGFVFPGGVVESSDFSPDWLDIFKKCGYSAEDLRKTFRTEGPQPEFYSNKPSNLLLPEVGFRIGAIRETFEESGLLLTKYSSSLLPSEVDKWRQAVYEDSTQFLALFREFGGCPAVWDLHEWAEWLTPTDMKKRFLTAFFITFMDTIPKVIADKKEVVGLQVESPPGILTQWQSGSLWLPPPQVYEVCRLLQFQEYDELKKFSEARGRCGIERSMPIRIGATDGIISVLPGDDLYPEKPDYEKSITVNMDFSIEELRRSKHLHRVEIRGLQDVRPLTNIVPKYGHLTPVNFFEGWGKGKL